MKIILKNNYRIIIWGVFYAAFIYMAYNVSVEMQELDFSGFLYGNLFELQKYCWDVSAVFYAYLFLLKKPFTSPMFVSRCKQNYFSYVIRYGMKICGFYTAFTFLLFYGIPILSGLSVTVNGNIIVRFLNLFTFLFMMYLWYLFLLIKTGRQMLSLLTGFGTNLIVLMVYYVLGAVDETLSAKMGEILMALYPGLAAVMLLIIWGTIRKKEWLDNEK